jgi:hypothetical protein
LAKSIEARVAQLERELAFLKSQGLTRDEQDSLLGSTGGDVLSRSEKWLWVLMLLQWGVIFSLAILIFFWGKSTGAPSLDVKEKALEAELPEKGKPFLLPGMRRR